MERNYIKIILIILVFCGILLSISVLNIYYGRYFLTDLGTNGKSLEVTIYPDKTEGIIPFKVNFTPIVLNSVDAVKYQWDFGDGFKSTLEKPYHTYTINGTYTCCVNVSDKNYKSSAKIEITANINRPPIVSISINKNRIERKYIPILPILWQGRQQLVINRLQQKNPYILGEGQIECFAKVYDPEGDKIISYKWIVTPDTGVTLLGKTVYKNYTFNGSSIKLPELYTWRNSRYVVRLEVEDSYGNKANNSLEFQVDKSSKEVMRAQRLSLVYNLYLLSGRINLTKIWNFLKALDLTKQVGFIPIINIYDLDTDYNINTSESSISDYYGIKHNLDNIFDLK